MKLRVCVAGGAGILALALVAAAENAGSKSGTRLNLDEPAAGQDTTTTQPTTKPSGKPAGTSTSTVTKGAPTKTAPTKASSKAKKNDAPPPKIDGMEVARGEKGFLGIKVAGGFRVSFYGPDKKPAQPDVKQVVLRWPVRYQPNDERALLTPVGDGTVFASDKIVKPPYRFKLYVTLLRDAAAGDDPAGENYVIDFAQE